MLLQLLPLIPYPDVLHDACDGRPPHPPRPPRPPPSHYHRY